MIVFGDSGGGYQLSVARELPSGVGIHGDSFVGMKVHGRTLSIESRGSSCAGAQYGERIEQFRYQQGDWYLIGEVDEQGWRYPDCGGGEDRRRREFCPELSLPSTEACDEVSRSINYSTFTEEDRWSIGPAGDDAGDKTRTRIIRKKLPRQALKSLGDLHIDY